MRKAIFAIVAALALTAAPLHADEEHDKAHAFNTEIPTVFMGSMETMNSPAGQFQLYKSGPSDSPAAILMVHEWWGLNAHIKGVADQFGALGYTAYAIDLYGGKVATVPDDARTYMKAVDKDAAMTMIKTALAEINKRHKRTGSVGWCFGGGWSLQASLAAPDMVDATVIYYGELTGDPATLKKLKGPVLGVFASEDAWITPEKVNEFEKGLKEAGVEHKIETYDAEHAFANPSGKRFKLEPARKAWESTVNFLGENLKKK